MRNSGKVGHDYITAGGGEGKHSFWPPFIVIHYFSRSKVHLVSNDSVAGKYCSIPNNNVKLINQDL